MDVGQSCRANDHRGRSGQSFDNARNWILTGENQTDEYDGHDHFDIYTRRVALRFGNCVKK